MSERPSWAEGRVWCRAMPLESNLGLLRRRAPGYRRPSQRESGGLHWSYTLCLERSAANQESWSENEMDDNPGS